MPQKRKQSKRQGVTPVTPTPSTSGEEQFEQARAEIKKMLAGEAPTINAPDTPVTKIPVESEEVDDEEGEQGEQEVVQKESDAAAKSFAALYRSDDGKVDMTTIVRKDPNRNRKVVGLVIAILLVLLGVSVAGFYFFVQRGDKFNEENIVISPKTPLSISSGEQFTLTLTITNKGSVAITNVEVTLQPPSDFMSTRSDPPADNEAKNTWQLDTIKGNSAKTVTVTGAISGDKGTVKAFNTVVTYRPANFNSDFTRSQPFSLTVSDSILSLDLSVPTKVVSGRSADYSIKYTNNGKETLERVRLIVTLPDDLSVASFNPVPTKDTATWEFTKLESKASGTISFKGTVTAAEGSARELKVAIGSVDTAGQYHLQSEETSIIFVVNPQLVLTLTINDSTSNNTANFGDKLNYVLKYRNDSQSEIKNMTLSAELTGEVLNWDSLVMSVPGTRGNSTITWTEEQMSALKLVKPGGEGEVMFSINAKETILAQKSSDKNYSVISKATATSKEVVDLEGTTLEVESNSVTTRLTSRLELRAEGRYYDDQFVAVGLGPLPPVVGSTTTYQVYWYVRNNANEVKNVTVKVVVPENAIWMDDVTISAGNLRYDVSTRTVTWSVNKIPPQVGQTIAELEARFAIAVTPLARDVGTSPTLLEKSEIRADDTFTEQSIVKTQEAVTTDLKNDPQAAGKGVVVESTASNTNEL